MNNRLEYCIFLRKQEFSSAQIKLMLTKKGLSEQELAHLLKESDLIHIEQLIKTKNEKTERVKPRLFFKTIILFISLFFLLAILFGHARVSIVLLILFWAALRSTGVLVQTKKIYTSSSMFNRWRKF